MGSYSQLRMCRPPHTQKWPYLHKKCPLCWNKWKINFPILMFLFMVCIYGRFWCIGQIHQNSTISHKLKISHELKIRFRALRIFSVNLATYERISFFRLVTHLEIEVTRLKIVNTTNHNSKNKIRKIDFSSSSVQFASFM